MSRGLPAPAFGRASATTHRRRGVVLKLMLFLGLGYLLGIVYLAAKVPAVADVIAPEQRSSALGVLFAVSYLIGGPGGPILVGILSDSLARGSSLAREVATAQGQQTAMMILVSIAFAVAAAGMFLTALVVRTDRANMLTRKAGG